MSGIPHSRQIVFISSIDLAEEYLIYLIRIVQINSLCADNGHWSNLGSWGVNNYQESILSRATLMHLQENGKIYNLSPLCTNYKTI
jgi:hypothetical protein